MKSKLYFICVTIFVLGASPVLFGAVVQAPPADGHTQTEATALSARESRKADRQAKRYERLVSKIQQKMERLQRKGKISRSVDVEDRLGLIVILTGALFIALGLVIPIFGVLFLVIGIIVVFAGLLLLLLLGGW